MLKPAKEFKQLKSEVDISKQFILVMSLTIEGLKHFVYGSLKMNSFERLIIKGCGKLMQL